MYTKATGFSGKCSLEVQSETLWTESKTWSPKRSFVSLGVQSQALLYESRLYLNESYRLIELTHHTRVIHQ
jgi:hypothetical protein